MAKSNNTVPRTINIVFVYHLFLAILFYYYSGSEAAVVIVLISVLIGQYQRVQLTYEKKKHHVKSISVIQQNSKLNIFFSFQTPGNTAVPNPLNTKF